VTFEDVPTVATQGEDSSTSPTNAKQVIFGLGYFRLKPISFEFAFFCHLLPLSLFTIIMSNSSQ